MRGILLVLLWLWSAPVWALQTITFDAASTANSGATNAQTYPFTFSHTVTASGGSRILVVTLSGYRQSATTITACTGVTYNGVALTSLTGSTGTGGNDQVRAEIWYLVNPATGSNTVSISCPSTWERIVAGALSFTGVHQSTPFGTPATNSNTTSSAPSVAVTSATGEMVIDVISRVHEEALTVGASQTQHHNAITAGTGQDPRGASSREAGAASVTMSWTGATAAYAVLIGAPLKQAPDARAPVGAMIFP